MSITKNRCSTGRYRDEACDPVFEHVDNKGCRSYRCKAHGQWIYDFPSKVVTVYSYTDGTQLVGESVDIDAGPTYWYTDVAAGLKGLLESGLKSLTKVS